MKRKGNEGQGHENIEIILQMSNERQEEEVLRLWRNIDPECKRYVLAILRVYQIKRKYTYLRDNVFQIAIDEKEG